jgi:hypothetical protein
LMGGAGMGIVGLVTSPMLGKIADQKAHERFVAEQPAVVAVLDTARNALRAKLPSVHEDQKADVQRAIDATDQVVTAGTTGDLPPVQTANAMRAVIGSGVDDPSVARVQALLGPAENFGGRTSFLYCVPLALIAAVVFAAIYVNDRRRGGYRVEQISRTEGMVGAH